MSYKKLEKMTDRPTPIFLLNSTARNLEKLGSPKKIIRILGGTVHTAELYYIEGYANTYLYKIHIYMP